MHTDVWYVGLISIFYMMKSIDMCFSLVFFVAVRRHDIDVNTSRRNRIGFLHCLFLFYVISFIFFSYSFFYDYFYSFVYSDWGRSNRNVYWKVHKNILVDCALFLRRCIFKCMSNEKSISLICVVDNNWLYIY